MKFMFPSSVFRSFFIPFLSLSHRSSRPFNRSLQVTDQTRGNDAEGGWKEGWKLQDGVKNW
jgi:hypothetical protein